MVGRDGHGAVGGFGRTSVGGGGGTPLPDPFDRSLRPWTIGGERVYYNDAMKDLVKTRMAVLAMEQLLAVWVGEDTGPLRFNRWNGFILQKLFCSVGVWNENRSLCFGFDFGGPFFPSGDS